MNEASPEMLSLFCAALERSSPDERAAYLDAACAEDKELRARIEALLRAHEQAGGFLPEKAETGDPRATTHEPRTEGPGTRSGPYKLMERIGEGGMGRVYKARDTRLERLVAIKLLPENRLSEPDRRARFIQEARAASALNHLEEVLVIIKRAEREPAVSTSGAPLLAADILAQRLPTVPDTPPATAAGTGAAKRHSSFETAN